MNTKNQVNVISRLILISIVFLGAFILLGGHLALSIYAAHHPSNGPTLPPRWIEFPVSPDGMTVEVYEQYIIWAQENDEFGNTCVKNYPTKQHTHQRTNSSYYQDSNHTYPNPSGVRMDICLMDTQSGYVDYLFFPFSDTVDYLPRMDGDWVVFLRGRTVGQRTIARNLVTYDEIVLANYSQVNVPNIHNNIAVFTDYPPGSPGEVIYAYDLTANQKITISSCYSFCAGYPDIYGGIVVWHQNDSVSEDYNILGYDISSQSYFTISDKPGNENFARIDHDLVVWEWDSNIYGYDLKTGERITITEASGIQTQAAVSEDLVVWMDARSNSQYDIYALDLTTGQEFQISDSQQWDSTPAVWGGLIGYNTSPIGVVGARQMTEFSFQPIIAR